MNDPARANGGSRVTARVHQVGGEDRERLWLELTVHGERFHGEAACLPGYSPETNAQQRDDLEAAAAALHGVVASALPLTPDDVQRACQSFVPEHRDWSPAARFAVETALAAHAAHCHALPIAAWWSNATTTTHVTRPLLTNTLFGRDAGADDVAGADGSRPVKVKIDHDLDRARELVRAAQAQRPGRSVRVDANGAFDDPHAALGALADLDIRYCEQPGPAGAFPPPADALPVGVALDETLREPAEAAAWLGLERGDLREWIDGRTTVPPIMRPHPSLRALVLKPTVLGGVAPCRRWADLARVAGLEAVFTHTFEGVTGFRAVSAGAASLPERETAHGLAPYPFPRDNAPPPAPTSAPAVAVNAADELDIRVQARRFGERLALVDAASGQTWTYLEAAQEIDRRLAGPQTGFTERLGVALEGGSDAESVLCVWTLLAVRAPILMVHPRLPSSTRVAWLARALGTPPDNVAVVIPTSGTTGVRKGIALTYDNLVAAARSSERNLGWRDGDRWWLDIPVAHIGGLSVVTRCMLGGAAVVAAPGFDASRYARQLAEHRVSIASVVPTMLHRMLRDGGGPPPTSLRAMLVGGAACPPPLAREARAAGWPVLTTYGLTEASAQVATQRYAWIGALDDDTAGEPLPGVELRLGDDDRLQVRGAAVAAVTHPADPGLTHDVDGWLDTGDFGELSACGVRILSRRSELIISGGENVYPQEVERVLVQHPGVREIAVFGVEDAEWGQRVEAAVVWRDGADEDALAAFARAHLPPAARPARYVTRDALPLTAAGKLDRAALTSG